MSQSLMSVLQSLLVSVAYFGAIAACWWVLNAWRTRDLRRTLRRLRKERDAARALVEELRGTPDLDQVETDRLVLAAMWRFDHAVFAGIGRGKHDGLLLGCRGLSPDGAKALLKDLAEKVDWEEQMRHATKRRSLPPGS